MTTMFAVGRSDLRRTHWREAAPVALASGQARFRIELFALTSNNVTYGAFGESMHYRDSSHRRRRHRLHPGLGVRHRERVAVEGIDVGERFTGYWPMADEVVVMPSASSPRASSMARRTAASAPRSTTAICAAAAIRSTEASTNR